MHSEYSLVCKYLQANLRFYANICKQVFDCMRNSLEVLQTIASKLIFWSKYLPVWENVKQIFDLKPIFASTCILHQIKYLYANLCKYFEASMKQAMWLNDVCKYWNIRIWSKEDPYSLRFASKLIKKLWI